MKSSLQKRLLLREQGDRSMYPSIPGIYGDRVWIDEMDIVNELGGHSSCVNALSWSNSGKYLASGSDDEHLNIYAYQPESSDVPFFLKTTVITGHQANIFSVKFMPHSSDGTLVTCAGDAEVRVFDIEHQGRSSNPTDDVFSVRRQRIHNFFNGMRYLTEHNTNSRVYRSHADRVKRIVTENSPHHFLTCSEDGEVRQWDLRQPSSAYPPPRGGQGFMSFRPGLTHDDSNVPPPLISYKKYNLDLNTISCSSTQPHYIALGGAHLHCFLHDRRMLGRDLQEEKGQSGSHTVPRSLRENESMGRATRCVKRFAPRGLDRMSRRDNRSITACKISDAYPNEMIASWSGDHIYSFDLMRSEDALEPKKKEVKKDEGWADYHRARWFKNRKKKRAMARSVSAAVALSQQNGPRPESVEPEGGLAFRVRYRNGHVENISFNSLSASSLADTQRNVLERARDSVLSETEKVSHRIAKKLVEVRKLLFSVDLSIREMAEEQPTGIIAYATSFTKVIEISRACIPEMNQVSGGWEFPLHASREDHILQRALRDHRSSSHRFVQAAGTLARALGGSMPEPEGRESDQYLATLFNKIEPAPCELGILDKRSQFGYDFLKAILLWLEGGREAMLKGFTMNPSYHLTPNRFPISPSAEDGAVDTVLIPYLKRLAGKRPVVNVDASRFEVDENRIVFSSQVHAVNAFAQAIKLPLEDLSGSAAFSTSGSNDVSGDHSNLSALDRHAVFRFWGLKVGRGILLDTAEGVNFAFVTRAFGGLPTTDEELDNEDDERQMDIDPNEEDEEISELSVVAESSSRPNRRRRKVLEIRADETSSEEEMSGDEDEHEYSDSDDEYYPVEYDSEEHGSGDDEAGDHGISQLPSARRFKVHSKVPCSSHMNVYRGHCNFRTVKDVNFFGLNDEYVVSGSDDGNFFIWDRKTSDLLNILNGDSETVNVVQGHPYEPTLAVSGIDSTIKIFSPDARAQYEAAQGINIADPDFQANMALDVEVSPGSSQTGERRIGLESRKRLQDSYQILSNNDVARRGGRNEALLTRSMLAEVASTLRARHNVNLGFLSTHTTGDDNHIILDDNCSVM